jgi:hypothetical protein
MPTSRRLVSASTWTRLLLGALGLTVFGLIISAFLAGIRSAAGDSVGKRTFSAFNLGLASFAVAECVALLAVIAVRLELAAKAE